MKRFLIALAAASLLVFSSGTVLAQQPPNSHANPNASVIPEKDGDYQDPENPRVRVRVFVHKAKNPSASSVSCQDPASASIDGVTGWHLNPNVTYRLNTSSAPSSINSNFPSIANLGYATWHTAQPKVSFTRGSDTSVNRQALDFQNIVAFGNTSGSALAVTYTRYYTATHEVADVDTIFNKKLSWSWTNVCGNNLNSYDIQNILTHELGHWMGLDDEYGSTYVDNTMFGYGSKGEIKKDTLTAGDISPLASIYP